ncbi:MAG: HEAT repeat domain-containing protein [Chloroflexota bacterium]
MPNLLEYHIGRLKDKNAEIRLKSINELKLLGDPTALEPLEQIFRTDSEPEVRKAAQEAGREIYLKSQKKP